MQSDQSSKNYDSQSGFALAWAAVLTIVAGMAAVTMVNILQNQQGWGSILHTQDVIEEVTGVITAYEMANGSLPCPAEFTAALDSANFGIEINAGNCTPTDTSTPGGTARVASGGEFIRIGAVPTRALGMPDAVAKDKWGNRLLYAVVEGFTDSASFSSTNAVIKIEDELGATISSNTRYYILSQGPDQIGAYKFVTGSLVKACAGTAVEQENCDNDGTFVKKDYPDY